MKTFFLGNGEALSGAEVKKSIIRSTILIGILGTITACAAFQLGDHMRSGMRENLAEDVLATAMADPSEFEASIEEIPRYVRDASIEIIAFKSKNDSKVITGSGLVVEYLTDNAGAKYAVVLTAAHLIDDILGGESTVIANNKGDYASSEKPTCATSITSDIGFCILPILGESNFEVKAPGVGLSNITPYEESTDGDTLLIYGYPGHPDGTNSIPFATELNEITIEPDNVAYSSNGLVAPGISGAAAYSTHYGKIVGVASQYDNGLLDILTGHPIGGRVALVDQELIDILSAMKGELGLK